MGRNRKYNSEEKEERSSRKWSMEYYYRNRAVLQQKIVRDIVEKNKWK